MRNTERLYDRVIEKMDMTCDMEDEELQELIHEVLEEASKEEFIPLQEKIRISKELFNAFRKLDILQELIEDDEITEIMINGTDHIFLEKAGRIFESDRRFVSVAKLEDVIQQIAAGANRYVNEASPIVDARLEDGSPCKCCTASGGIKRSDHDDSKISKRGRYNETADRLGKYQSGSGKFLKNSCGIKI